MFLIFLAISLIQISSDTSKLKDVLIVLGIHIVTFAFLLYTFFNVTYKIEANTLTIRCGFLYNKVININDITKIEKTSSLLSSPAASLTDRIEVSYIKFNSVIISPENREAFLKDLLVINSSITLDAKLKSS